ERAGIAGQQDARRAVADDVNDAFVGERGLLAAQHDARAPVGALHGDEAVVVCLVVLARENDRAADGAFAAEPDRAGVDELAAVSVHGHAVRELAGGGDEAFVGEGVSVAADAHREGVVRVDEDGALFRQGDLGGIALELQGRPVVRRHDAAVGRNGAGDDPPAAVVDGDAFEAAEAGGDQRALAAVQHQAPGIAVAAVDEADDLAAGPLHQRQRVVARTQADVAFDQSAGADGHLVVARSRQNGLQHGALDVDGVITAAGEHGAGDGTLVGDLVVAVAQVNVAVDGRAGRIGHRVVTAAAADAAADAAAVCQGVGPVAQADV